MKKKFISVAMFLALTASAPVWVSCSDYDDDIANLQSQVDELKGGKITADQARAAIDEAVAALKSDLDAAIGDKANNADVQTLMDKVAELSDALNGNSDDQTVVGLVAQVQSLIERVNKIEDTSLSQMQKDLENGLDGLRKEYEEADKLLDEAIAQKATSEEVEKLSAELKEIQGNLQEALEDLAALKGDESTSNLTESVNKLIEDYATISSQLAEKASKESVEDLNKRLETIEADVINFVDITVVNDLQEQIKSLTGQLAERPTNADVAAEIDTKIEALGDLVSYDVYAAYKEEIEKRLGEITDDIADHETRLQEVEEMAENNGEAIASLTLKIDGLKDLLDDLDSTVSDDVLGKIIGLTSDIDNLKDWQGDTDSKISALEALRTEYEKLNSSVANMQTKLTQAQLAALSDIANWDSNQNGSIVSVLNKVIDLENALNAMAGEGETVGLSGIATQLNTLESELERLGLMAKMIQSIVFVPNFAFDNNGTVVYDKRVSFKTLQMQQPSGLNYTWKTMAESKERFMQFRISPANLTKEEFEERYDISFYGKEVKRSLQDNVLTNVTVESLENGLLTLKVTSGETVKNGEEYRAWALSARITPKTGVEGNEQFTDIFSDYFVVDNSVDRVQSIKVLTDENPNGVAKHYDVKFEDRPSYNVAANEKFIGVTTSQEEVNLATEYPSFQVKAEYSQNGNSYYFNLADNVLTLTNDVNQSAIGQTTTVTATVNVNGINYTTNICSIEIVEVAPEYNIEGVPTLGWFVGTDKLVFTVPESEVTKIMSRSGMTQTAFWDAIENGQSSGVNGMYFKIDKANKKIEIYQEATTNIAGGTLEFKFETAETGRIFTLKAEIQKMTQYPELSIKRELQAGWDGNTIGLLPNTSTNPVSLSRDLTTVFTNYDEVASTATNQGGSLKFNVYVNDRLDNSYLVGAAPADPKTTLKVTADNYNANQKLRFELVAVFGTYETKLDGGDVFVENLSGSWVVSEGSLERTLNSATGVNLAQGFEWKAKDGSTMWKDGENKTLGAYGLAAPTFTIESGKTQYVEIVSVGGKPTLKFTDNTENYFQSDWTITVKVTLESRWGAIEGYNEGTKYITVTIPAGTYTQE